MVNKISFLAVLVFTLGLLSRAQGANSTFAPEKQKPVAGSYGSTRVSLERTERCPNCTSVNRFRFQVTKHGKLASRFSLANETAQVDQIYPLPSGRTAIFGRINSATAVVTILDNSDGKILDSFFGFRPSISPKRRFIAFVKAYPNHFVSGESDEYLYRDLSGEITPSSSKTSSGTAFYPSEAHNVPGDNVNLPLDQVHRMASVGFDWLNDSRVAFVDLHHGQLQIVQADLGLDKQALALIPLDTHDVVGGVGCETISANPQALRVSSLSAKSPGKIRVTFWLADPSCLLKTEMNVDNRISPAAGTLPSARR